MNNIYEELNLGMHTAFLDHNVNSLLSFRSEFISNDYIKGKKLLVSLEEELAFCDSFCISVAFITQSGITPLLQTLKELEKRNIKGKILTTDYLLFTEPKALSKLASFKNIELKMFITDNKEGFHTKGYIFKKGEIYRIIIGSSNMTLNAITVNREWNTRIVSSINGEIARDILNEFDNYWYSDNAKAYEDIIDDYQQRYTFNKRKFIVNNSISNEQNKILVPNKMQQAFIDNLKEMIDDKQVDRAMLISATGTGKTYASAFALKAIHATKTLFVVHREQIAKQALASYRRVFGFNKNYVLLSGNSNDIVAAKNADFVFATMQMMAKEEIRKQFGYNHFTNIVLDECHHAGAESYKKIMDYFKPNFWLGMTASPDTTRFNVYEIFNHNIAYEIRLQQALEEDLLCPFHYFGITDIEIEGNEQDDISFNQLVSDDRVNYIIEQAEYYGYSGKRVKGLIFCSRKEEAYELSNKFNQKGYNTAVLTGEDSEAKREITIERLIRDIPEGTSVKENDALDYIFSIDIFSEGIDIPQVNQVIMLRPTKSPIVFIQQLGRGLRKYQDKEYVVILDFIGNYNNNFMIPIALSGDRSYNKDTIRRYMMEGTRTIPGASTIHFDEISQKRIFSAIDKADFSEIKLIKDNYIKLKNKLGRIPEILDFDLYGEMDIFCIINNKNLGSYYKFLEKYDKDYKIRLSNLEAKYVEFISKKLANGKRIQELILLELLIAKEEDFIAKWKQILLDDYKIEVNSNMQQNIINIFTNEFPSGSGKKTYQDCIFINDKNNKIVIDDRFTKMLENDDFLKMIKDLISLGKNRYEQYYKNRYKNTDFALYQKYTYEDVCRILNWEHNQVPLNIGGYKYDSQTKTFPIFINYIKDDDISASTNYEDRFINNKQLISISKSGRTVDSEDVQNFLHAKERNIDVELFVRKNKDDAISKEFYYLGKIMPTGNYEQITMKDTNKSAVEIEWSLDTSVRDDIYDYIIK